MKIYKRMSKLERKAQELRNWADDNMAWVTTMLVFLVCWLMIHTI